MQAPEMVRKVKTLWQGWECSGEHRAGAATPQSSVQRGDMAGQVTAAGL